MSSKVLFGQFRDRVRSESDLAGTRLRELGKEQDLISRFVYEVEAQRLASCDLGEKGNEDLVWEDGRKGLHSEIRREE